MAILHWLYHQCSQEWVIMPRPRDWMREIGQEMKSRALFSRLIVHVIAMIIESKHFCNTHCLVLMCDLCIHIPWWRDTEWDPTVHAYAQTQKELRFLTLAEPSGEPPSEGALKYILTLLEYTIILKCIKAFLSDQVIGGTLDFIVVYRNHGFHFGFSSENDGVWNIKLSALLKINVLYWHLWFH